MKVFLDTNMLFSAVHSDGLCRELLYWPTDTAEEDDNPYALPDAVSPHIAAHKANVRIDLGHIEASFQALRQQADAVVVEGAGGFIVPLHEADGEFASSADLAQRLSLPVSLVGVPGEEIDVDAAGRVRARGDGRCTEPCCRQHVRVPVRLR